MIKLKNLIKEDLIGDINNKYEVYKNPKSIKRMEEDIRGMSFPNGDLIVVNDSMNISHYELTIWLNKNGYKVPFQFFTNQGILDALKNGYIAWQRKGTTNEFWLAESISFKNKKYFERDKVMPYLEKNSKKVKSRNSQYKFVLETIR